MGCGRDQTIGTQTPSAAVGHDLLLSRPPEERRAIQPAMAIINQPTCRGANLDSCHTDAEYKTAWKQLAETSPFVGYQLLLQDRFEWPDLSLWRAKAKHGAEIPQALWNAVLAFQWNFENTSASKRLALLEEVATDPNEQYPLVFVEAADFLLRGDRTPEQVDLLNNVRDNLLSSGAQVVDNNLPSKVRSELWSLKIYRTLTPRHIE